MKHFYTLLFMIIAVSANSQITTFPFVESFSLTEDGTQIDAPDFYSYTQSGATGGFFAYGISGSDTDYAFTTQYNTNAVTGADLVAYGYLGPFTVTEGVSDGFLVNHSTYSGGPQNFHFIVINAADELVLAKDASSTDTEGNYVDYDYFTTTATYPTYDSSSIDLTAYVGQTISVGIYVGLAPITVSDYMFTDDWTIGSYDTLSNTEFSSIGNSISIYPNPSTDYINFSGLDNFEISEVTIFNQLGQISKRIEFISNKSNSVDVSDLSTGLYFVEITSSDNQKINLNFIKK